MVPSLTPYDLPFPQNGGPICPHDTRMAISPQLDLPTFDELCDTADEELFSKAVKQSHHVLQVVYNVLHYTILHQLYLFL